MDFDPRSRRRALGSRGGRAAQAMYESEPRRPGAIREPVTAEAVAFLPPGTPTGRASVVRRGKARHGSDPAASLTRRLLLNFPWGDR
jgi:hypothetical protein